MPVIIHDFEIVVPTPEPAPATPAGAATAAAAPPGSAELARQIEAQVRLALERSERLLAD